MASYRYERDIRPEDLVPDPPGTDQSRSTGQLAA